MVNKTWVQATEYVKILQTTLKLHHDFTFSYEHVLRSQFFFSLTVYNILAETKKKKLDFREIVQTLIDRKYQHISNSILSDSLN